jgi:hypothetical protein
MIYSWEQFVNLIDYLYVVKRADRKDERRWAKEETTLVTDKWSI